MLQGRTQRDDDHRYVADPEHHVTMLGVSEMSLTAFFGHPLPWTLPELREPRHGNSRWRAILWNGVRPGALTIHLHAPSCKEEWTPKSRCVWLRSEQQFPLSDSVPPGDESTVFEDVFVRAEPLTRWTDGFGHHCRESKTSLSWQREQTEGETGINDRRVYGDGRLRYGSVEDG